MCGIVYGRRKNNYPIGKAILKRFEKQRSRGIEGFGFVPVKDGVVGEVWRHALLNPTKKELQDYKSGEMLFHHRKPTSTPNRELLNHPIVVKNQLLDYDYYVVHNGIILNDAKMKPEHEALGFKYTTEYSMTETLEIGDAVYTEKTERGYNDSEAFAIDLVLTYEGHQDEMKSTGSIAFVAYQVDKETNKIESVLYGRNNGRPLIKEENGNLFFLRSEGQGAEIDADVLYVMEHTTGDTLEFNMKIGTFYEPKKSAGYDTKWNKKKDESREGYPEYNEELGNGHTDSYFMSEQRLRDLEDEREILLEDLMMAQTEIAGGAHDKGSVSKDDRDFLLELIKETRTKLSQVENEISWMEETLGYSN